MNERDSNEEVAEQQEALVVEVMKDSQQPVSEDKAFRFYDRIRKMITMYLSRKGRQPGRIQDALFFAPDIFILLWRLTRDERVSSRNKVLLGTAIAYFIFPLDIMPEALLGPIGLLDDVIFGVYVLNRMLVDTDEQILRDHWSGSGDVLEVIQRLLKSADGLVASDVVNAIKKMVK